MSGGNALAVVKAAQTKGALVFANIENMEAKVDLYRTEVTELVFKESDFHKIGDKFMPSKAATDRMGEACGVQFIQAACRVTAETRNDTLCGKRTVYRAEAQGKIRMPDGSWRTSTVDEYEFDPVLRAMLDKNVTELNEQTKKTVGRAILEFTKMARQRAATGARLRVIRQLTGMPAGFEKGDTAKPFVFTRIVQNTDYILQTPEGRAMATAQALGWDAASLFGARKDALPPAAGNAEEPHTPAETAAPGNENSAAEMAAAADEPDFPDDPADPAAAAREETQFERLSYTLDEIMSSYKTELDVTLKTGKNPYTLAENELNNASATDETRQAMIDRLMAFLKAKGVSV